MSDVDATLPSVSIADLRMKVSETKAKSTARYYLAMLNRLEEFVQSDTLSLEKVDPDFVARFGDYLVRNGVTPSSVKLFQMSFRAVMKDVYGKKNAGRFKSAFCSLGSKNETKGCAICFDELLAVNDLNLDSNHILWKSRAVYMYCVFAAGMTFDRLKETCIKRELAPTIPQQKRILREFTKRTGKSFQDYVPKIDAAEYEKNLAYIGVMAKISGTLTPDSTADAWTVAALKCGLPADLIASTLARDTAFTRILAIKQTYSRLETDDAMATVANKISDEHPRWYVMRCYSRNADDTAECIKNDVTFLEDEHFNTFTVPKSKAKRHRKPAKSTFLDSMLFFNCTADNAAKLKRHIGMDAYVYTRTGSSVPAVVSDNEMKRFMLLCDVSSNNIDLYFPQEETPMPELNENRIARIIDGDFSGNVGVVKALKNDKFRVVMTFTSLGGLKVSAIVPIDFLQFD